MIVITDILKTPFDEGAKVATFNLLRQLKQQYECIIFSINGSGTFDFVDFYFKTNRLLFDLTFYRKLIEYSHDKLLYIPEASITVASIVRGRILQILTGGKVTILSLQPRKYNSLEKLIIRMIQPDCVLTQSLITSEYLKSIGLQSKVLPLGVNHTKYNAVDKETKRILRNKYTIGYDKTVLLHIGHLCRSRNLDWLLEIKLRLPETEVIIVGSNYNVQDQELYKTLVDRGIVVIREYLPNIEIVYNIADYYVFPVVSNTGAIETPLSVLEAMSCNLPIITTRFGSLPDVFAEDECFYFVNLCDEVIEILKNGKGKKCNNRSKIKPLTWSEVTRKLVEIIG